MHKAPFYYNLDVIIAVGYRVKSPQGTLFRQWATERLKEYARKTSDLGPEHLWHIFAGMTVLKDWTSGFRQSLSEDSESDSA